MAMKAKKAGLLIQESYFEAIDPLPDEERLQLYDSMTHYVFLGELPALKGYLRSIWAAIRPNIDSSRNRYNAAVENGMKGGRPPGSKSRNKNQNINQSEKQNTNHDKDENKNINIDSRNDLNIEDNGEAIINAAPFIEEVKTFEGPISLFGYSSKENVLLSHGEAKELLSLCDGNTERFRRFMETASEMVDQTDDENHFLLCKEYMIAHPGTF